MNDKKPMKARDLTAILFGIALTGEISKKERKKLINTLFEAELGIKDFLPINEEENSE